MAQGNALNLNGGHNTTQSKPLAANPLTPMSSIPQFNYTPSPFLMQQIAQAQQMFNAPLQYQAPRNAPMAGYFMNGLKR